MNSLNPDGIFITVQNGSPADRDRAVLDCVKAYAQQVGIVLPRRAAILRGEHEKPRLNIDGIHFSVTHSGGLWVCGVSGSPLGLDLEFMREDCKLEAVARRFFHPEEIAYLEKRRFSSASFFPVWTAKESFVKFTGEGISDFYSSFSAVRDGSLSGTIHDAVYRHFPLRERYSFCVCSPAPEPVTFISLPDA